MSYFKPKKIKGVVYSIDHLNPFIINVDTKGTVYGVEVIFSNHCFTEKFNNHTPDYAYVHEGERRAFSIERYELSKQLNSMIATLGSRSVYHSMQQNFFLMKVDPMPGYSGPYVVFFNTVKAKKKGVNVLMNVESAYMKPGMAETAAPVKFTTLVEFAARGRKPPLGPPQRIIRK